MSKQTEWKLIAEGLERIEVPGGWLYRSFWVETTSLPGCFIYSAPTFVQAEPEYGR